MDPLDEAPGGMPERLDCAGSSLAHAAAATANSDPFYTLTDELLGLVLQPSIAQASAFVEQPGIHMSTPITEQMPSYSYAMDTSSEQPLQSTLEPANAHHPHPEVVPMDTFSLPNSVSAAIGLRRPDLPLNAVGCPPAASYDAGRPSSEPAMCITSPVSCYTRAAPGDEAESEPTTRVKDSPPSLPARPSIGRSSHKPRRHKNYRPRKHRNSLSRPPGIGDPWVAEGAPERAPRDAIVVRGEQMLGQHLAEGARTEGVALYDHLIQSVCDYAEKNKAGERHRLQDLALEGSHELDSKVASRIEARLSRHKKDVYIAALALQIKNLCEDLCVLKSVASSYVTAITDDGDFTNSDNVQSRDKSPPASASKSRDL